MRILLSVLAFFYAMILTAQTNNLFDFAKEYSEVIRVYNENKWDSVASKLQELENVIAYSGRRFAPEEYVITMCTLSEVYARLGKLNESEQVLDKAERVLSEKGEQSSPYRRMLLMQRGQNCLTIEDVDRGKELILQAKLIFETERDNKSVEYALCLSRLALAYQKSGEYCLSNILLNYSVDIIKEASKGIDADFNVNMESHYLTMMNNIAMNYQYMGDYDKASSIRKELIRVGETDKNNAVYFTLVNSAFAELQRGNFEDAIHLLNRADEIDYGYMYKDYVYQNLLLSLYHSDNQLVVDLLKQYIKYTKENFTSLLLTFAESERENYWSQRSLILELITNAISWKYKTPEINKIAYNNALYTKSLMTRFSKIVSDYVRKSASNTIKDKFTLLSNLKKRITAKDLSADSLAAFQKKINTLEREIVSSIKTTSDFFDESQISCDKVREKLKKGEVAIEFVLIPEYHKGKEDIGYYGALIERPEFAYPHWVKLCELDSLDAVMRYRDLSDNEYVDSLYSLHNERLYNLIFQPLEKHLHLGETIFFSPVRNIHKINLSAIAVNGHRLMDNYHLIEVSSTAKIIENAERERIDIINSAYLVGGVDYNEGIADMVSEAMTYPNKSRDSYLATRSINRGSWDVIPGTLSEAMQIDSVLRKHKVNTILLSGGKANEESFKNLDGSSPDIIHIATHGFFYEEKGDAPTHYFENANSYANKRLPMQYSGILLAGANNAWLGNMPPMNIEDGILTAEEISQMDLSGTKMAVLSACDTGLGEIDDIDGVYGLQRGLKMAGVETIVMSLWKIPDDATIMLMAELYKNLMQGKTKQQSLKDAQDYLRHFENGKYDKPEYWASFIMLDGLN